MTLRIFPKRRDGMPAMDQPGMPPLREPAAMHSDAQGVSQLCLFFLQKTP